MYTINVSLNRPSIFNLKVQYFCNNDKKKKRRNDDSGDDANDADDADDDKNIISHKYIYSCSLQIYLIGKIGKILNIWNNKNSQPIKQSSNIRVPPHSPAQS